MEQLGLQELLVELGHLEDKVTQEHKARKERAELLDRLVQLALLDSQE